MIRGIGIDAIDIERFSQWPTYSSSQLKRIFSLPEIAYCLENQRLSAERFAARFAVREAFFKALYAALPQARIPFLTVCKAISIPRQDNGLVKLMVDWDSLMKKAEIDSQISLNSHISLTHTKFTATAIVILEEI